MWPLPCRSTAAGGDTDQERAIAHTRTAARIRRAAYGSANLVKLGAPSPTRDGDSQSARAWIWAAIISFKDDGLSISAGSAANDSLQAGRKATWHQMPAPQLCQPVHQQLWRRWGRHPGLQPECQCCQGQIAGSTTPRPVRTSCSIWRVAAGWPGGWQQRQCGLYPVGQQQREVTLDQERAIAIHPEQRPGSGEQPCCQPTW